VDSLCGTFDAIWSCFTRSVALFHRAQGLLLCDATHGVYSTAAAAAP
jgi:hypothetical protein